MDATELEQLTHSAYRYELVAGNLKVMSPAGGDHGRIAMKIAMRLANHVESHGLGIVLAAETGFRLSQSPDTVLAPDVSFVSTQRYDSIVDKKKYIPFAPQLAVEVMSPSDTRTEVDAKSRIWIEAGTQLVLVVDPEKQILLAHRTDSSRRVYGLDDLVDCSDVVSGWKFLVSDIF